MTHASSKETLGHYFTELLSEPAEKNSDEDSAREKNATIDPATEATPLVDSAQENIQPALEDRAAVAETEVTAESATIEATENRQVADRHVKQNTPVTPPVKQHELPEPVPHVDTSYASQQRNNPLIQPQPQTKPLAQARPVLDKPDTQLEDEQKTKLQALLNEQALAIVDDEVLPSEPQTTTAEVTVDIAEPPLIATELAQAELTTATSFEQQTDILANTSIAQQQAPSHVDVQWADNGRPQWAQARFEALLFNVAGLTLAVPLVALGQIVTLDDSLTPIFGQSDWFMGIMPTAHGKFRVVNTALFVMPEKYQSSYIDKAEYAISLDGVPWALAVDSINQPVSLDPEEIKWRSERSKRPWLAGTVKSAMCALLDIPQMAMLLVEQDHTNEGA